MKPRLIGPWRRAFQWITAVVWFALPLLGLGGRPLLRFDIPSLTLFFLGRPFMVEDAYLFWLATILFALLFLFATMVFGRLWCGWACPQTSWCDGYEALARRLDLKIGPEGISGPLRRRGLLQGITLAVSLWAGATFVWYFVAPAVYAQGLFAGRLGPWPLGTTLVVAGILYFDLPLVRRLVCREFCPYGRIQTALADSNTLTLTVLPGAAGRCIHCQACVRACPMGIDIRHGVQIECINCARCLDACRLVMAKRREPGLIGYLFGDLRAGGGSADASEGTGTPHRPAGRGWRLILSPRFFLLGLVIVILASTLVTAILRLPGASFEVIRLAQTGARKLPDGRLGIPFSGMVINRGDQPRRFAIKAKTAAGEAIELRGGVSELLLGGHERSRVSFALVVSAASFTGKKVVVSFSLVDEQGAAVATARARVEP